MPGELYILLAIPAFIGIVALSVIVLFRRVNLGKKLEATGIPVEGTIISFSRDTNESLVHRYLVEYTFVNVEKVRSIMYHRAGLTPGSRLIIKHLPECKKFVVYTDADW